MIVLVVELVSASDGDHRGMVQIVVPDAVEAEAAGLRRPDEIGVLRLVLRDEDDAARSRRLAGRAPEGGDDVILAVVVDVLRRVEAQTVEAIFVDPVGGVGDGEVTHADAVGAVVVERLAPVGRVPVGEIIGGEAGHEIAVRTDVVVDDVEDHPEAERMGAVDEAAEVVGFAIDVGGRE